MIPFAPRLELKSNTRNSDRSKYKTAAEKPVPIRRELTGSS